MTTTSAEPPVAKTESTPGVAGLAQRLLTLPPAPGLPVELYAKRLRGHVDLERTSFRLAPHTVLTTNTYSGRVPASYWQRWTAVREMTFEAETSGEGRVELYASDPTGEERFLTGTTVSGEDRVSLTVALDRFIDDDIVLEPESIIRMTAFANSAREPVIVGAQMLYALHPKRLHTGAEFADLVKLQAGKVVPGALWNTDLTEENQELRVDADYNAWWSALLPSEIVSATGYPLPVFFQWDDIEYGYRARENGFTTVTLPGAGVWHADFTWKDQDDWSRYFSIRNSLITSALHTEFDSRAIAVTLFGRLVAYIAGLQYGLAATVIKGIDDFLQGPEILADGGQRVLGEVRELRKAYSETVKHDAAEVPGVPLRGETIERALPDPSQFRAVLAKRLLWQLTGRTAGSVAITAGDAQWWHVSRYRRAIVTDASQEGVRVRDLDRDQAVTLLRESAAACYRLARRGPAAAQQYREALPQLTSRENWRRLFGAEAE